jgi:SAM-dependent methyltransferase
MDDSSQDTDTAATDASLDAEQTAEQTARRAASFGAAAADYARYRPDYPIAAIRWGLTPVTDVRRSIQILDLGAGTGKLTAQLASLRLDTDPTDRRAADPGTGEGDRGAGGTGAGGTGGRAVSVIAVEPDPQMLAELRRQLPAVSALAGHAESIPLPDASVDAVVVGQAAHWFDHARAVPEIARVLRPGGTLACLWNADDSRVDWVTGLHMASGRRTVVPINGDRDDESMTFWLAGSSVQYFRPAEEAEFDHSQAQTTDSMIATLSTHSMFLIMEPAEREAVLAHVREYLAATPATSSGEFTVPLRTLVIRAVRTAEVSQPGQPARSTGQHLNHRQPRVCGEAGG